MATAARFACHQARTHWTQALSLALAISSPGALLAQPEAHLNQRLQQHAGFDIAPQALSAALIAFAQQTAIQISVDSALLANRRSPGVRGQQSAQQALQQLLAGSGLRWRWNTDDSLSLELAPDVTATPAGSLQIAETMIEAEKAPQGETRIDRQTIERLPAGNGDITSLLKIHPHVQFDNSQLSSKSPGEIAPANISINGAKFYQNAFVVDGMNMNNDLNPGDSQHNLSDGVPGRSQGLALDTDLLDNITVHDSNVAAQYGGFNGGVVEANTRKPTQDFHGKISYQTTSSDWTQYHVDEDELQAFEGAASGTGYGESYQPEFRKHIYRATLEGHLTENFGLLADFAQKESTIPVHMYSPNNATKAGYSADKQDEQRTSQNFFLKGVWKYSDRLDLESSLTYAPEESGHYRSNALDSGYQIDSGGLMFNFKSVYLGDLASYSQNVSLSRMENSRDSDADSWNNWQKSSEKNWGIGTTSLEGGYGDIEQRQDSFQYKAFADWNELNLFNSRHRLQTGVEYRHQQFDYERLTASTTDSYTNLGSLKCATLPGKGACDDALGQYSQVRAEYNPGQFQFNLNSWALFAQDEIQLGNLMLRPGLRLDNDSYMSKTTLAPRFALEWDVLGDRQTRFTAGINRYYGRNSASWRLQQGRSALQHTYNRNRASGYNWVQRAQGADTQFDQLDIAYDDELTFGITQMIQDVEVGLKWVRREGRDQVMELENSAGDFVYTNDGESNTEIVTLTLTPQYSLDFWGTQTSGQLAADWTHHNTNHNGYAESVEEDRYVYYGGSVIHISQLPPSNYTRDWTYRLTTHTEIPAWNLNWSQFFRYRAGVDTLKQDVRSVNGYRSYYDKSYGAAFSWDMRLAWELPTAKDQAVFVNLDVYNVTDKVNASDTSNQSANFDSAVYETGRQFWVEVGYRF